MSSLVLPHDMFLVLFTVICASTVAARAAMSTKSYDQQREEMRDFIIFKLAVKNCDIPRACQEKVLKQLIERTPPSCDSASDSFRTCLKKEILGHQGTNEMPLELEAICCTFANAGPLCPDVCRTSIQSISMKPHQIYEQVESHCGDDFEGDTKIRLCIEAAHKLHPSRTHQKNARSCQCK